MRKKKRKKENGLAGYRGVIDGGPELHRMGVTRHARCMVYTKYYTYVYRFCNGTLTPRRAVDKTTLAFFVFHYHRCPEIK